MNEAAIWKAVEYLEEQPLRFDMLLGIVQKQKDYPREDFPPCGTVCCLAGAAVLSAGRLVELGLDSFRVTRGGEVRSYDWSHVALLARDIFDIHYSEGENLFFTDRWPLQFQQMWTAAGKDKKCQLVVLRERVQFFIKTKGEDVEPDPTAQVQLTPVDSIGE
jgi:hypothetical protein